MASTMTASTSGELRVIAPPPLIYAGGLIGGTLIDRALPLAPGYGAPFVGLPLVPLGFALGVWAARRFRDAGTTILPYGTATSLVPDGPYRFSRNPMYVAMLLVYAGVSIAIGSWWALLLVPVVLAVLHFGVIRREERHLEARFGEAYLAYKRRVRRWL